MDRSGSGQGTAARLGGVWLLERDGALRELAEGLASAAAGSGRLVLLAGEAGVGKTSVVRRFGAAAPGGPRVLVGACEPLSSPRP
ncbi:MAG TPA: AAA family ATPase, partial [Pseudonocardia sp.]|nr:AAA family ATPase [Pseudonocardia sp.]